MNLHTPHTPTSFGSRDTRLVLAALIATLLTGLAVAAVSAGPAEAAQPPLFTRFPSDGAPSGAGANQMDGPSGMATDPVSGHAYVADSRNDRISEFTAWGEFVKTWGWGVVESGPGNKPQAASQVVTVSATGGSFSLHYVNTFGDGAGGAQTTGPIPFNATAAAVGTELEALPSFLPGEVVVSGIAGGPWSIGFAGRYADVAIPRLEVTKSTLTGGAATGTVQTVEPGGNFEVCVLAEGDTCRAGQPGDGLPGQIRAPTSIVRDSTGNFYVYGLETSPDKTARVEKFDPNGDFLLMIGGEVNATTGENLCTKTQVESGDVCGPGVEGTAVGEFAFDPFTGPGPTSLALSSTGTLYVADKDRIQEFEPNGAPKSSIPLPEPGTAKNLAVDSAGNIFLSYAHPVGPQQSDHPLIFKHTSSGWEPFAEAGDLDAESFPIHGFPGAMALDSAGNLYVVARETQTGSASWTGIVKLDPSGNCITGLCPVNKFGERKDGTAFQGIALSLACGRASEALYATRFPSGQEKSYIEAFGLAPDPEECPAPHVPPSIEDQYTLSAGVDKAIVRGRINPEFWPDTTYYVQYGPAACPQSGWTTGCKEEPASPGTLLGAGAVNIGMTTEGVVLPDLEPDTAYHYRFVATSGGGGPVFGRGGTVGNDGEEGKFHTAPVEELSASLCPNAAFRTGASALLPDCRAYEMVSPVDKEGGDIAVLFNSANDPASIAQGASDGNRLSYSAARAFGDVESAPYSSQYLAERGSGGWSSAGISPMREGVSIPSERRGFDVQYQAFSDDLCAGWLVQEAEPRLAPTAPQGYTDLYRRDLCGDGGYRPVNTTQPNTDEKNFWLELQGTSTDTECAVFRANGKLTSNASEEISNGVGIYQVYESCGSSLRLVSMLPEGSPSGEHSSAGTASGARPFHREQAVSRAVSADGSRVYWTAANSFGGAAGKIYVRENSDQPQSAIGNGDECTQPARACTYRVSESISAGGAKFLTADLAGNKALFTIGGNLYQFDFASKASSSIAGEVAGLLGASDDLSRIYLVSREARDTGATATKPNLYLYEGGQFTFIATLSNVDAMNANDLRSPVNSEPSRHVARITPDGEQVAFMSTASLTGFVNKDASSGEADAEVYLYDASAEGGDGKLLCVSCLPTGARPSGRAIETYANNSATYWAAAQLPAWGSQLYPSRALASDGSRLFFESFDPLVSRDDNGMQDVYEWQLAASPEQCREAGAARFAPEAGGCISLISSGGSPEDSGFVDASSNGSDVFIATAESLLPQDPDLVDIYDARIEGGFTTPPAPRPPCEGEVCQGPPPPSPGEVNPSSSTFSGPGDPPSTLRPRCPKAKHRVTRRGKPRCVSNRGHKQRHNGKQRRRSGR